MSELDNDFFNNEVTGIVNDILVDYGNGRTIDETRNFIHPDKDVMIDILDNLKNISIDFSIYNKSWSNELCINKVYYLFIATLYFGILWDYCISA